MSRNSLSLFFFLGIVGTASAGTWAEGLFGELSKDFGSVPRGPALQHAFVVKNTTADPIRISALRVSCGCVTATSEKSLLQPGEETTVVARMDTTRFFGVKSVTIFVHFDQPKNEEVRLWVRANATNDVQIMPDTLALGTVKRGAPGTTTVRVTFQGNGEARIAEISAESNYVQPTYKEIQRQASEVVYEVTAKLRPDAPAGRWFTDVWLKLDNPAVARIRVPLTVEIESPLSVSPPVVSLGDVTMGTEVERRLIVRGIKNFRVVSIRGTDASLSVQDSADSSKPAHVMTLKFKPNKTGDFSRKLEVVTDLDGSSSVEVQTTARVIR